MRPVGDGCVSRSGLMWMASLLSAFSDIRIRIAKAALLYIGELFYILLVLLGLVVCCGT